MKKIIIIIILLLAAGAVYVFTRPGRNQTTIYKSDTPSHTEDLPQPSTSRTIQPAPNDKTPQPNSGNLSPETGWSAFPKVGEQPAPDVTAQINVGAGSPEPKTISARQGQRVSITFTASIRDQVVIEGYNYDTYIEPLRDSTLGFTADKKGSFKIRLVNKKTVVGILNAD